MIPTTFISYSWDSEEHKEWVRKLADHLIKKARINTLLDQYELSLGKSISGFMESSVIKSETILVVCTPNYKLKAENRQSGVGAEYSMISQNLIDGTDKKIIAILREGSKKDSIPEFLKANVYLPMHDDDLFESDAFELIREIYNKPKIVKPDLGPRPNFEIDPDPIYQKAIKKANKKEEKGIEYEFLHSRDGVVQMLREVHQLFKKIETSAEDYKSRTKIFFKALINSSHEKIILNTQGAGIILEFFQRASNWMEGSEILVTLYNRNIGWSINRHDYFPSNIPKVVEKVNFIVGTNYKKEILWVNDEKNLRFRTSDFIEFLFLKILDESEGKDNT